MSGDEEATAIGQMVARYAAAKKQTTLIDAELARIAEGLNDAALFLSMHPDSVSAADAALLIGASSGEPTRIEAELFDFTRLARLLDERKELADRIASLEPRLGDLGLL